MRVYQKSFSAIVKSKLKIGSVCYGLGVALLLLGLVSPFLVAQTASADTSGDVEANLIKQGWYISNVAKQPGRLKNPSSSAAILQNTVNDLKNKKPAALAILDNSVIPSRFATAQDYADYLRGYINPKVDIVVIVNGDKKQVGLSAANLSSAEQQAITDAARSTFTAGNFAEGVQQVANAAAQKITDAQTTGTLTTIGIVVLVLVLLGGGIAFLLISTRNSWKRQLEAVQNLNNQVSDLVVRVSDGIDYLPDQVREQTSSQFGQATTNMSNAEAGLRELQAATPIQLIFSGGKYRQQLNATSAQLQTSLNLLQQLDRSVEKAG